MLAIVIAPEKPKAAAYTFADVQKIVAERCATCHAAKPTQPGFNEAPKGVLLETPAPIVANAQKINEQAVVTKAMPIGNLTGMTDAERATLGAWIAAAPRRRCRVGDAGWRRYDTKSFGLLRPHVLPLVFAAPAVAGLGCGRGRAARRVRDSSISDASSLRTALTRVDTG